jgi:hypothetical protein
MKLADDLLPKAGLIADYVFGHNDEKTRRKVYYQFEKAERARETESGKEDVWPLWKSGQEIVSRKSLLDSHFQPKSKKQVA